MGRFTLTNRWALLALIFFTRLAAPLQFQSVAAVTPFLRQEFGYSFAELGTLIGLYSVPGALLALPGGMLGDRFGTRPMVLASLALMVGGGVVMTAMPGMSALVAARLMMGMGAIVLQVQTQAILGEHFHGRELATAYAIGALAFGVGVGMGMGLLTPLAAWGGWRLAVDATTGMAVLGGVTLALLLPGRRPAGNAMVPRLWTLTARDVVLCAVAGCAQVGFVTGYVVFMSFAPLALAATGLSVAAAGVLVSQAAVTSLFSVPLGGYLVDRTGRKNSIIVTGALGAGLSCLLLPIWGPALLWVLLFGALRGGCTGGVQSLPGEVLGPHNRGSGLGVFFTVHYVGLVTLPVLAGWLLDAFGPLRAPIWLSAGLYFSIVLSLLAFRLLQRRWPAPAPR